MGVEIRVEGLTKRYGSQTIWNDVTLTLPAGEISMMLGPSGTGKSVFLKTLVGLLKPDAGSIWIEGQDLTRLNQRDRAATLLERLMHEQPDSQWHALAERSLRQLQSRPGDAPKD